MDEVVFSVEPEELSCIVGNLFTALEPPCGFERGQNLTICGTTHSGSYGRLVISEKFCLFAGRGEDLEAVRNGRCLEGRCKRG